MKPKLLPLISFSYCNPFSLSLSLSLICLIAEKILGSVASQRNTIRVGRGLPLILEGLNG
jgi:hypothetical protein